MGLLADYDAFLHQTLGLSSLTASIVLRVVVRPSFDPECAFDIARDGGAMWLTIHTLDRSAWGCMTEHAAPADQTSKPTLTVERSVLGRGARGSVTEAIHACRLEPSTDDALVLDGVRVILQTPVQHWERKVGPVPDRCSRLAFLVFRLATRQATSEVVHKQLARSLRGLHERRMR